MTSKEKSKVRNPRPKKSLGQNFLVDQNFVEKIISVLDVRADQTVVEIGAGRGALTKRLIEKAQKVIAIELDRNLLRLLREEFASAENFLLIEQDALEVDFASLVILQSPPHKTKLVANLPYYISTAILRHLIQYRNSFSELILMLQKEVVERIIAKPGNKERGFLTVMVQNYFAVEKLFDVPPNAFRPVPKVMSSVIRLKARKDCRIEGENIRLFRDLVSCGFAQKRKTLRNNFKNLAGDLRDMFEDKGGVTAVLNEADIDPNIRAEALSGEKWTILLEALLK